MLVVVVVVLQMCQDKDQMIDSQSSLVSGLRNMTALQDRLGKAKDAALKILQKTVYEMVEKIRSGWAGHSKCTLLLLSSSLGSSSL